MSGMEIDSPSPRDRIVQRLAMHGVPQEYLQQFQLGLIPFVRENKCIISEIVSSILPTDLDLSEAQSSRNTESPGGSGNLTVKDLFEESILWLQWLMFESDPQESFSCLANIGSGERAVCGAVWGHNDLAYRCRTCEHDPTCAICVSCFQNGNHKDHDYNIMYTGGGCCDCGDATAWKKEGFCSKHKGTERIRPLPQGLASSIGPVLDYLLLCWKEKVVPLEHKRRRDADHGDAYRKAADGLSSAIIQMLLDFCNCSESLLSFISRRMTACSGLLDLLLKAERLLDKDVVKKLHELLLKLLGDPLFKYDFAKIFIGYYPTNVKEMIKDSSDSFSERYPMLSTFSVQLFTVPTLTLRLVTEVDLLAILLGCLKDLFLSCVDADGHLQASKWANMHETTIRLIEDLRYVMSHQEVSTYVALERPDITKTWIFLLGLVQGMDAQKRVTGLHTEEENENLPMPFVLGHYLGNVNSLLVGGTFSVDKNGDSDTQGPDDIDRQRHAKVGRVSQESSASRMFALDALQKDGAHFDWEDSVCFPSAVVKLISECLKAMECWLRPEIEPLSHSSSYDVASSSVSNILALRKKFRVRKGTNSIRVNRTDMTRMDTDVEVPVTGDLHERLLRMADILEAEKGAVPQSNKSMCIGENNAFCPEHSYSPRFSDDSLMEIESSRELAAFSILKLTDWPTIDFDVSSQEISFHIPLHRLLSLLLRKAFKACCHVTGHPDKTAGITTISSSIHHQDFFRKVLVGLHPCGFSAFIMEHPLQLRAFCAQVRAGMWRKNGDAAILSSDWYRSVQWLEQGLESDLFLLQCCAALAPPDSFVQRILERFGLSSYMSLKLADYNEYEPILVQEMLTLIIHIVKERRFCGSSTSENLRRELVYRLAIGDVTHSQLVKSLPRDLSKSDELQNAVDMLAVYCHPSGMKQGKYSLRKAYWKELDLYHPRWTSRDLQVAEDRYFRVCKVSALNAQLLRWSPIFGPLFPIYRIATSKMILQIIRVVLFYAFFSERSSVSRAPDTVLITALHLLSLALDICETLQLSHSDDPLPILTFASEEFDVGSNNASVFWKNQSMLSLLVSLMRKYKEENDNIYAETRQCNVSSLIEVLLKRIVQLSANCMAELKRLAPDLVCNAPKVDSAAQNLDLTSDIDERRAKARQRQAAILEKMRAEQSKFIASLSSNDIEEESHNQNAFLPEDDNVKEESTPVCSLCRDPHSGSPLCFLILLQKSRLTSFVELGPPTWQDADHDNTEMSSAGKEKLIDSPGPGTSNPFQLVQNAGLGIDYDVEPADVDTFLDFIRERIPISKKLQLPTVSHDAGRDSSSGLDMMEDDLFWSIIEDICGAQSYSHSANDERKCSTSLSAGSNKNTDSGSVLGEYFACLSKKTSKQQNSSMYGLLHLGNLSSKSKSTITRINRFSPKDCDGIHISSCGHAVHQECHERYLASLKQRNIRRLGFEGGHIIDPDLGELLCPVCRRFANSVLPAAYSTSDKSGRHAKVSHVYELNNIFHLSLALSLLQSADKMVGHGRFLNMSSGKFSETTQPGLEATLRKLYTLYFPHNYNDLSASGRLNPSLVLWDTLRYSLVSTEIAARGRVRASSASSTLEALHGELRTSSGFILSLLLHVAKSACISSSLEVFLRRRGIQLLAGSICFVTSGDNTLSNPDKKRGSSTLEHEEMGESFPDVQFWKRAAEPILSHDPFSSLMWLLFCLPSPFMQSSEFFIPLVNLFYAVCVIQSLITCYSKDYFAASNFSDSLLNDVCKAMGESSQVKKYFVSNYIDPSCHPKDMIRRLTFPFLRRCALLWKLLQTSTTAPLYDSSHVWEGLNPHARTDALEIDSASYLRMEVDGIRELEDLFHVPSLESVLKDEVVHSLALKWCEHFCDELRANRCGGMLCYTPAVPFKLMQLPRLYQDLLQRYVKLKCRECKHVPDEPALCLLCGKLCSPSWKSCCRASRCLNHAISCGAGIGVFLLVRRTTILLQRASRQAFWPSPYLDAFGEEDIDMYRGKPLFLNDERYAALTYLVASHGLDRTSEVLRQTTISVYGSD